MKRKVLVAWSGGKDSALALEVAAQSADLEIVALLTVVNEGFGRTSLHGVGRSLLRRQAARLGYPLVEVAIPERK